MKIIFTGLEHEFYDPRRGVSFEYTNFYSVLKAMPGVEALFVPFDDIPRIGKKKFNAELLDTVRREKPNLVFAFMFSDEFEVETLEEMKRLTTTLAWFADDSWRFANYSRYLAPHFTWTVTTYSYMPAEYKKIGQPNVIRSQWAANPAFYKPLQPGAPAGPDVSFVGGWSKPRAKIIDELEKRGIKVSAWGVGWDGGRLSDEERNLIFGTSKINLGLNAAPGRWNKNSLGRLAFRHSIDKIVPSFDIVGNIKSWTMRNLPQIKARHFEIPACGGFVITSMADDLDTFYTPEREMVFYKTIDECVDKIHYYLSHEKEREEIARAGYERTMRDHTYEKRFEEIFRQIGFSPK